LPLPFAGEAAEAGAFFPLEGEAGASSLEELALGFFGFKSSGATSLPPLLFLRSSG